MYMVYICFISYITCNFLDPTTVHVNVNFKKDQKFLIAAEIFFRRCTYFSQAIYMTSSYCKL